MTKLPFIVLFPIFIRAIPASAEAPEWSEVRPTQSAAASILDIERVTIERPGTFRKAFGALEGLISDGSIGNRAGSVEVLPFWLIDHPAMLYRQSHTFMERVVQSAAVSMAVGPQNDDKSDPKKVTTGSAAIGFRTSLYEAEFVDQCGPERAAVGGGPGSVALQNALDKCTSENLKMFQNRSIVQLDLAASTRFGDARLADWQGTSNSGFRSGIAGRSGWKHIVTAATVHYAFRGYESAGADHVFEWAAQASTTPTSWLAIGGDLRGSISGDKNLLQPSILTELRLFEDTWIVAQLSYKCTSESGGDHKCAIGGQGGLRWSIGKSSISK